MNKKDFQMDNIAIIGLSLFEGSFAKAIKRSNVQIGVSAFDKNNIINKIINETNKTDCGSDRKEDVKKIKPNP